MTTEFKIGDEVIWQDSPFKDHKLKILALSLSRDVCFLDLRGTKFKQTEYIADATMLHYKLPRERSGSTQNIISAYISKLILVKKCGYCNA